MARGRTIRDRIITFKWGDYMTCKHCGSAAKRVFCSKECYQAYNKQTVQVVCPECGLEHSVSRKSSLEQRFKGICCSCRMKTLTETIKDRRYDQSGEKSHAWRGGSRSWQPGKLGRDKDNLSWRVQRQLAWERDKFTCQDCGKKKDGWKPDCHHIIPYRLSLSHDLENLKCLCQSCHKKAEAKIVDLWGGVTVKPPVPLKTRPRCQDCGNVQRKLTLEGICIPCSRIKAVQSARILLDAGHSHSYASRQIGLSRGSLYYWLAQVSK